MKNYYNLECKYCGASPIRVGKINKKKGRVENVERCLTCGMKQR